MADDPLLPQLLGFVGLFVAFALALKVPPLRRRLGASLQRFREWASDRLEVGEPRDELDEDLARVVRLERLSQDLDRLRRLVSTDASMSATRQFGNRIAYAWVRDAFADCLGRTPDAAALEPARVRAPRLSAPTWAGPDRATSRVEVLDVRW